MRVGIVSWWFHRGQATVSRWLRSALDELGHRTFVLARPSPEQFVHPARVDRDGIWDQPGVDVASADRVPPAELLEWASGRRLDLVFFDQYLDFEPLAQLRESGVGTVGRFVWEQLEARHVRGLRRAYDLVYTLTDAEHARYRDLYGLDPFRVPWGIHPEWLRDRDEPGAGPVHFFYPGGFLSHRKSTGAVVRAMRRVRGDVRLVLKAQRPLQRIHLVRAPYQLWLWTRWRARRLLRLDREVTPADLDPRIELHLGDLDHEAYVRLLASCDVCLAPSRWEGLGLHFFEATGLGLPILTNDAPPMNELVEHEENGLLVASRPAGHAASGIPAMEVDERALAAAIDRAADRATLARLTAGALRARERLAWSRTVSCLERLLERACTLRDRSVP